MPGRCQKGRQWCVTTVKKKVPPGTNQRRYSGIACALVELVGLAALDPPYFFKTPHGAANWSPTTVETIRSNSFRPPTAGTRSSKSNIQESRLNSGGFSAQAFATSRRTSKTHGRASVTDALSFGAAITCGSVSPGGKWPSRMATMLPLMRGLRAHQAHG